MLKQKIYIGARASALAQSQALIAARALACESEILPLTTKGDQITDTHLRDLGGKDLFVRDIETALLSGKIDLAVHSLKDMPAIQPAGLRVAAILPRADPRDALVTKNNIRHLCDLPQGAQVGTASPRRQAQIKSTRADLEPVLLRGNVDTRLKKIMSGELAAALLALAGLARIERVEMACALEPEEVLPAAAQGTLCIECRSDDQKMIALCASAHDVMSEKLVMAERSFSSSFGASCYVPVAALAQFDGDDIFLRTQLLSLDGSQSFFDARRGASDDALSLGQAAARAIAEQAGADFLREIGAEMKL